MYDQGTEDIKPINAHISMKIRIITPLRRRVKEHNAWWTRRQRGDFRRTLAQVRLPNRLILIEAVVKARFPVRP